MGHNGDEKQAAVQRLIDEAMKQPGVADVMKVYQQLQPIQDAAAYYELALRSRTLVFGTNSSSAPFSKP